MVAINSESKYKQYPLLTNSHCFILEGGELHIVRRGKQEPSGTVRNMAFQAEGPMKGIMTVYTREKPSIQPVLYVHPTVAIDLGDLLLTCASASIRSGTKQQLNMNHCTLPLCSSVLSSTGRQLQSLRCNFLRLKQPTKLWSMQDIHQLACVTPKQPSRTLHFGLFTVQAFLYKARVRRSGTRTLSIPGPSCRGVGVLAGLPHTTGRKRLPDRAPRKRRVLVHVPDTPCIAYMPTLTPQTTPM